MAQPIAGDALEFARLLLQTVERLGEGGAWVPARDAFERAAADHPEHPYLAHIAAKPGRRTGLSAITERLRAREFAHIERRKAGTQRNAPVMYRVGRPGNDLALQLPHDAPPSHPLVTRRRAVEAHLERASSARRVALTEPAAKSPWRRRLLARPSAASAGAAHTASLLHRWWRQLQAVAASVSSSLAGR